MSKYINAEKLKAEIRRIVEEETPISKGSDYYHGVADTADKLLSFITSLQQEQQEVDLEKEIEWEWVHREKQEVDLIECAEMDKEEFARFARHFWEKGYNARKEE